MLCPFTYVLYSALLGILHDLLRTQIIALSSQLIEHEKKSNVLPVGSKPMPRKLRPGCPGFWSHSALYVAQLAGSSASHSGQEAFARDRAAQQALAGLSGPTHTYPASIASIPPILVSIPPTRTYPACWHLSRTLTPIPRHCVYPAHLASIPHQKLPCPSIYPCRPPEHPRWQRALLLHTRWQKGV